MDPAPPPPPAAPVWAKRRQNVEAKNDDFFISARSKEGRVAPVQWMTKPTNVNASDKEKPLAGGASRQGFKPRTRERLVNGTRQTVGVDRTTGVTAADVAATKDTNDRFFRAAQAQGSMEKYRAGR